MDLVTLYSGLLLHFGNIGIIHAQTARKLTCDMLNGENDEYT